MLALPFRSRTVAALLIVLLLAPMLARRLSACPAPEAPAAVAAESGVVEQQAAAAPRRPANRLLFSLLGLAVTGGVVAILVLTVFKKKGYEPHIVANDFVAAVNHPFLPLVPGRTLDYIVTTEGKTSSLAILETTETRMIMGILCQGVHERLIADERLGEDTWRWHAQDRSGNVWYFARETKTYDYADVTGEWSWQAGVDDAKPGQVLPADPGKSLNKEYWQAFAPGTLEEKGMVVGLDETITVPAGTFGHCLKVRVTSSREPGVVEYRYYASGIGLVLSETGTTAGRRVELAGITSN